MNNAELLADATNEMKEQVARCNALAKRLIAECEPFLKSKAEDILDGDAEELLRKATAVMDAREELRERVKVVKSVRRRM